MTASQKFDLSTHIPIHIPIYPISPAPLLTGPDKYWVRWSWRCCQSCLPSVVRPMMWGRRLWVQRFRYIGCGRGWGMLLQRDDLLLEGLLFGSGPILCRLEKDGLVNTLVRSHQNNSKHTPSWICAIIAGAATWVQETQLCSQSLMTSWDWKYKSWNRFGENKNGYVSWRCHSMLAPSCARSRHPYECKLWEFGSL